MSALKFKHKRIIGVVISLVLILQCFPTNIRSILASADTITLNVWVSKTGMGEVADYFMSGERCYLCYELKDSNGNLIPENQYYKIDMAIYNPNDITKFQFQYSCSSNNWISSVLDDTGIYNFRVAVSGAFEGTSRVAVRVIPNKVDVKTWLSDTGMGEARDLSKRKLVQNDSIYFCYKLCNFRTDKLIDKCCKINVTQSFIGPDGHKRSITYDNNNNWFRCTLDKVGSWTYTLEITGDLNASIPTTFTVYPNTRFYYGKNNWSFDNSPTYFKHGNYYMNDSDTSSLYNGLSFTEKAKIAISKNSKWEGSCYGMTALAVLAKSGEISSSVLPGRPVDLYSAASPASDTRIESAINYYQLLQQTNVIQQLKAEYSYYTQEKMINILQGLTQAQDANKYPFLLGFAGTFGGKKGSHAVTVYGYESLTYNINKEKYDLKLLIYDPNSVDHNDMCCLYINTSSHKWCIPGYQLGTNWNQGRLSYVISSYYLLNYHGLYSGISNSNVSSSDRYYSILSVSNDSDDFTISKVSDTFNLGSAISADNEIKTFYDAFGDDVSNAYMNAVLPDPNAKYLFKTEKNEKYDLRMSYKDMLYNVKADKGTKAVFSPEGECVLDSDGGRCSINAVFNDKVNCPIKWSNLTVDIPNTNHMSVQEKNGRFILESDSLKDSLISSVTDYMNLDSKTLSLDTNGKKAMIYSENDSIIAKVYGDLNDDMNITISDYIILKKWLLGMSGIKISYETADICENDKLDVFDLCALKNILIGK